MTVVSGLQYDSEDGDLSHPVLQDELRNPKNGDSAHKHLKQQVGTNRKPRDKLFYDSEQQKSVF